MKQESNQLKKAVFIVSVLLISVLLITGCNGGKKGSNEPTPPLKAGDYSNGDTSIAAATMQLATGPLPFYTLNLTTANCSTLLDHKDVIKILAQVIDNNDATATALSLVAYGVDKKGVKITGPVNFFPVSAVNPSTFNPGSIVMANQELTLKQVKEILGLPKTKGKIDLTKLKDLQFEPKRLNTNHCLFYLVTQSGAEAASGIGYTNPSPPKPPCEIDCDY